MIEASDIGETLLVDDMSQIGIRQLIPAEIPNQARNHFLFGLLRFPLGDPLFGIVLKGRFAARAANPERLALVADRDRSQALRNDASFITVIGFAQCKRGSLALCVDCIEPLLGYRGYSPAG